MDSGTLEAHPLWQVLEEAKQATTLLEEVAEPAVIKLAEDLRQLQAITEGLRTSELVLLTGTLVEAIASTWAQLAGALPGYVRSRDRAQLNRVRATTEQLRAHLATVPRPLAAGAARHNYARVLANHRDQMRESAAETLKSARDLMEEVNLQRIDFRRQAEDFSVQVSMLGDQIEKLQGRISSDEARLSSALAESSDLFIRSQGEREADYKSWLAEQADRLKGAAKPQLDALESAALKAAENLSDIERLRTSTVDMANLASGDILAGKYGEYAKGERSSAYIAYALGAVAGITGIVVVLFAFGPVEAGIEWPLVALKFGLTVVAGGLAAVGFRFGGHALRRSTSFKRQELELRALQPFLQDVDGADKAKVEFLSRAFGRAWDEAAPKGSDVEVNESIMKLLTAMVQNTGKQGGAT